MKLPIVLYVVSKKEILLSALIMSANSIGMFMEDRTTASTGICFMFPSHILSSLLAVH
ncbi:unnamed protein product [Ixodes pacificus]